MTDLSTLRDIAERLERAEGPDKLLDCSIALLGGILNPPPLLSGRVMVSELGDGLVCVEEDGMRHYYPAPEVTTSLDAAIAFTEAVLPKKHVRQTTRMKDGSYAALVYGDSFREEVADDNECVALLTAVIRALIAIEEQKEQAA